MLRLSLTGAPGACVRCGEAGFCFMVWLRIQIAWAAFTSRRPSRSTDNAAEIAALETGVLIRKNVGLDVAECRVGLVLDAVVEGLDDVLLEAIAARMRLHHRISLGIAVLGIGQTEHIHLDAGRDQGDDRMHVSWNAG